MRAGFEWNSKQGSRVFSRPETARRGEEAFLQFTERRGAAQANGGASRFFSNIAGNGLQAALGE